MCRAIGSPIAPSPMNPTCIPRPPGRVAPARAGTDLDATSGPPYGDARVRFRAPLRHAGRALRGRSRGRARRAGPGRGRASRRSRASTTSRAGGSTTSARCPTPSWPAPGCSRSSRSARRRGPTRQRTTIVERLRDRRPGGPGHPLRDRFLLRLERLRAHRRRALRRPPLDGDGGPRGDGPGPSGHGAPRPHLALVRRGVPVPRPAGTTRRSCSGCHPRSLDLQAPGAGHPGLRLPALVVLRRGPGPDVLDQPRALPRRVGEPGVPPSPVRRTRSGRSMPAADAEPARRTRNLSPWAQWQLQLAAVEQDDPFPESVDALGPWRGRVRHRLSGLLGPDTRAGPARSRGDRLERLRVVPAGPRHLRRRGDDERPGVPPRAERAARARARGARRARSRPGQGRGLRDRHPGGSGGVRLASR